MRNALCMCAICALFIGCATTTPQVSEEAPTSPPHKVPEKQVMEPTPEPTEKPEPPVNPTEEVVPQPEPDGQDEPVAETSPEPPVEPPPVKVAKRQLPETCTYKTYQWSTVKRKSVNRRKVRKKYAELTVEEKAPDFDTSGCTVCEEDQVEVAVEGLPTIKVCWSYAPKVEEALTSLKADKSFRIQELIGYRCGQTRGRIVNGMRTEFSNHSFGTAIDINSRNNGLYRRCDLKGKVPTSAKDIARCKKGIGGEWNPEKNRKVTVTPTSRAYELLTTIVGWKWGGEIPGRTKDFMHFSVNGF